MLNKFHKDGIAWIIFLYMIYSCSHFIWSFGTFVSFLYFPVVSYWDSGISLHKYYILYTSNACRGHLNEVIRTINRINDCLIWYDLGLPKYGPIGGLVNFLQKLTKIFMWNIVMFLKHGLWITSKKLYPYHGKNNCNKYWINLSRYVRIQENTLR